MLNLLIGIKANWISDKKNKKNDIVINKKLEKIK